MGVGLGREHSPSPEKYDFLNPKMGSCGAL